MTNPGETSFDMVMKIEHTVQPVVTEYVDFQFNFRSADGSPLMGVAYMVGFEVEIDHDEHVHHFVGYTCPREHDESSNGKSREDLGCEMQFLTWAPGSNRLAFPSDVALPVGPGTSHRSCSIEVHYDNPDKVSGVSDSSLVKLIMVTSPRAHDAAFLNLGDQILISNKMIPAGQPSWGVTSRCILHWPLVRSPCLRFSFLARASVPSETEARASRETL